MEATSICHVVAMPYPGRGHINPMMNLCKVLAAKAGTSILITFVFTEEWLGFMASEPKPDNIRFVSIPNVVPSELVRAADMIGFLEAVWTKMEAPFERLLDTELLHPPPTLIMADTFLSWVVRVGNRRDIPVASFWTMSSSMFSFFHHFNLLKQNGHFPINLQGAQEKGEERVEYIPGISSTKLADFPMISITDEKNPEIVLRLHEHFTFVANTQYLLLPSIYELEPQAVDALKTIFSFPIRTIGPAIPYFNLDNNSCSDNYFHWLDRQPRASVLYVSLGSFLSVSSAQMDEIAAGLRDSGVRFLWVARDEARRLGEASADMGLVVPWCDQLRVLSHSSVGGFLSHCGWSSTREGLFCGIPFLTFPLLVDQLLNSKLIVEDWKVGRRVKKYEGVENAMSTREEIAGIVQRFMDLESEEGKEMRKRAKHVEEVCQSAIAKGGSSENDINSFISNILKL